MEVHWTEYLKYRIKTRGFDLTNIENIIRYGDERYIDTITQRRVVIGKDSKKLVMIPYESKDNQTITPITVHATSRQQINFRIKSGRFKHE